MKKVLKDEICKETFAKAGAAAAKALVSKGYAKGGSAATNRVLTGMKKGRVIKETKNGVEILNKKAYEKY